MEKTTIYLTAAQKAALSAAAREQGRSEARLIREGIDGILSHHRIGETVASLSDRRGGPDTGQEASVRPRWMSRDAFIRSIGPVQADSELSDELRDLAPDLTDELPPR